jgi:hypothetical protein
VQVLVGALPALLPLAAAWPSDRGRIAKAV